MFEQFKKPVGVFYEGAAYCLECWGTNPQGENIYANDKKLDYNPGCNSCGEEIVIRGNK